jgi:membrane fusion protein (multidrug efflux system)
MRSINSMFVSSAHWKSLLFILACGLAGAGCDRQNGPPPSSQATPRVSFITVTTGRVEFKDEMLGSTSPYLISEIRPQVNGLIQKRLFMEGTDVKAGQELYQIDPAPFQAAVDSAIAALGRSEALLPAVQLKADRLKNALAEKAVSQQDYDDASAALKQCQADISFYKATVETAKINLGYARIVSPISGRIGPSAVTDGAIVTAYQPTPLASIQQLDPIYVDVPQPTTKLLELQRRLKEGGLKQEAGSSNQVLLILEDGTLYSQEGTFQFSDVSVDKTTASVIMRMVFPNPNHVLLPGMFVRAVVKEGVNDKAILIPQQAVSRDVKGNPLVLLVNKENKVESRPVEIERTIGDQWLISKGLQVGDRVITEGSQKVRPGMQVEAAAAVAGAEGAASPSIVK